MSEPVPPPHRCSQDPGDTSSARRAWVWIWNAGSALLVAAGGLLMLAMMSLLFQRSSPGATIRLRDALLWACLIAAVSGYAIRLAAALFLSRRRPR